MQPISKRGGKRPNAGRKPMGYKMVSIRMTEDEKIAVKEFLKERRNENLKKGQTLTSVCQ